MCAVSNTTKSLSNGDSCSKHVAKVITVYSESEYVSESLGEGMMVDNIQTRSHGGEGFQKKNKNGKRCLQRARSYFGQQGKERVQIKKKLQIMYKGR